MSTLNFNRSKVARIGLFITAWLCCAGMIGTLTFKPAHGARVPDQEAEISVLLDRAERAILKNRLTTPSYDNAMNYIEQALALDPDYPHTKRLVNRVVQRYAALVNNATRSAGSAVEYLQSAMRFRDRAHKVALSHKLPMTPIERMDELIALAQHSLKSEHRDDPKSLVNTLLDSHLHIGRQALTVNDLEESAWHAKRARSLVERYRLSETQTTALERQITTQGGNQSRETELQDSSDKQDSDMQRQILTELSSCHIETALAYLDLGKLDDALRHQRTAQYLVTQNNLEDSGLLRLRQRIDQQRTALTLPSLRLFGNF